MEKGGYDPVPNENPWVDHGIHHDGDDDDRDEEVDRTHPFTPTGASTPGSSGEHIEMHTPPHGQCLPDTSYDESIPLLGGDFIHVDDRPAFLERAKAFIKARFPKADFSKIPPISFGKKTWKRSKDCYAWS